MGGTDWDFLWDLSKSFDCVNHDIVMAKVARVVEDRLVLKLIREFFEARVMEDDVCKN